MKLLRQAEKLGKITKQHLITTFRIKLFDVTEFKVILDFIPNHTSDNHTWFQASSDPDHPDHDKYRDYYVWEDALNEPPYNETTNPQKPPNNWVSERGVNFFVCVLSNYSFIDKHHARSISLGMVGKEATILLPFVIHRYSRLELKK